MVILISNPELCQSVTNLLRQKYNSIGDEMKRTVIWAAVSTEEQAKKISLEDQLRVGREHAAKHDLAIVAELIVPGESRSIVLFEDACRRIAAYAQLRDLIATRAFDVLIYLDRSRLGRKASLSMAVVELCREADIFCYETESPPATLAIDDNHDDMLVGAIKSVGAQREIIKLQHRHKMGMIDRINKGKFPAAVPWGWCATYATSLDGKRLVQSVELDPVAASLIRQIFIDWYLAHGLGVMQIAERLNELGHKTPQGVQWHKQNVQAIFKKVYRYAGFSEVNVRGDRPYTRAKGNWPAIITEEEAQTILVEKERRRTARRSVSDTYLFSGAVWCAHCNRRMIMATNLRNRPSKRIQLSMCCRGGHPKAFISVNKILKIVQSDFDDIQDETTRARLVAARSMHQTTDAQSQLDALDARLKRLDSSQSRIDQDYYIHERIDNNRHRSLSDAITQQRQDIAQQQAEFRKQLSQQQSTQRFADSLADTAQHGIAWLNSPDVKAANAWLRQRLKIYVADGKVIRVEYLQNT